MNVYDFDGTIFPGDCSIGFAFWCLKRHPKLWVTYLPDVLKNVILYKRGKVANYLMQRKMFSYLTLITETGARLRIQMLQVCFSISGSKQAKEICFVRFSKGFVIICAGY